MTDRPAAVLTDPAREPDERQVEAVLGEAYPAWCDLAAGLDDAGLTRSWRHYRDGGWLCRARRGEAVAAWLGVRAGFATSTCYFAERHRPQLLELPLPEELLDRVAHAELVGRTLPVPVEVRTPADAAVALEVVRFKLRAR